MWANLALRYCQFAGQARLRGLQDKLEKLTLQLEALTDKCTRIRQFTPLCWTHCAKAEKASVSNVLEGHEMETDGSMLGLWFRGCFLQEAVQATLKEVGMEVPDDKTLLTVEIPLSILLEHSGAKLHQLKLDLEKAHATQEKLKASHDTGVSRAARASVRKRKTAEKVIERIDTVETARSVRLARKNQLNRARTGVKKPKIVRAEEESLPEARPSKS